MNRLKKKNRFVITAVIVFMLFSLCSCKNKNEEGEIVDPVPEETIIEPSKEGSEPAEKTYTLELTDEGQVISYASDTYYRYGPSIMRNEDGSYDAWFSSPGNSGSQWDWLTYRHSDDGVNWSSEEIVLKPTPGSKDQCSVCDPAVIRFNGYYYLGYTATDYYEGQGSYNMAFVARSEYPDGPFEKWNGSGWGGSPEPIIYYDGAKENWGIGEVSFVIKDDDLFIYYSCVDVRDVYIGLAKADLVDDWPATIRDKGPVLYQLNHDSVEVVYDEFRDCFFAFTIDGRMLDYSRVVLYVSDIGKEFVEVATLKDGIEDFAHNMGVSKSETGWIDSRDEQIIGYAYGEKWGRWDMIMQKVRIDLK